MPKGVRMLVAERVLHPPAGSTFAAQGPVPAAVGFGGIDLGQTWWLDATCRQQCLDLGHVDR